MEPILSRRAPDLSNRRSGGLETRFSTPTYNALACYNLTYNKREN